MAKRPIIDPAQGATELTTTNARLTIKDIAKAIHVSPMTVSNVINGKFRFVSERTRQLVEEEIARTGYRVQKAGRSLKGSRHMSIGMVIVDDSPAFLADPFTAAIVAGLSNRLSRAEHALSVQGVSVEGFRDAGFFRRSEVDGFCIILSGSISDRARMLDALTSLAQPTILLQEPSERPYDDLCVVRQDDAGGGYLIAQHLQSRQPKKILLILPAQQWPALRFRESGLRSGVQQSGQGSATVETLVSASEEFEDVREAIERYLARHRRPDAIVGGNDRIALSAMAALQARDIEIPKSVAVVGFNAFEPRKYVHPLLTTVKSQPYQLGEIAAETMLGRLGSGQFAVREVVLPVTLEVGSSS